VGRRARGGRDRPLDGGSGAQSLAKLTGESGPSIDETADARRILLWWPRHPFPDRPFVTDEHRLRGGHAGAVAGLPGHA
jgi:hypothetical protein